MSRRDALPKPRENARSIRAAPTHAKRNLARRSTHRQPPPLPVRGLSCRSPRPPVATSPLNPKSPRFLNVLHVPPSRWCLRRRISTCRPPSHLPPNPRGASTPHPRSSPLHRRTTRKTMKTARTPRTPPTTGGSRGSARSNVASYRRKSVRNAIVNAFKEVRRPRKPTRASSGQAVPPRRSSRSTRNSSAITSSM